MNVNGVSAGSQKRFISLDGLRGVAALIVVCHHFCCAFLPKLVPDLANPPYWLADTPLGILINGPFSVSVFFVLSGFVVARAAVKSRDPLYLNIPFRYLRLALPVTVSVIFAWGLLTMMPDAATRLNDVLPNVWLSDTFQHQIPGFFAALYNGFFGAFGINLFHLNPAGNGFNNALWTMRVEAEGSIAIYMFYGVKKGWLHWTVLVLIGLQTIRRPIFLAFIFGAIMMEQWYAGKLRYGYALVALLPGILMGFPSSGFAARFGMGRLPHLIMPGVRDGLIAPIAAALILYAVLNSALLDRMLSSTVPNFLGCVSFPLYLVHVPLLYTVFAVLYLRIRPASHLSLIALFLCFIAISLLLAWAGEAGVDRPVLDWISWSKKKFRSNRDSAPIH